jgi:hypothetical protein
MRAFIVSVALALIVTTSAVAAAMEYLDQVQTTFARRTAPETAREGFHPGRSPVSGKRHFHFAKRRLHFVKRGLHFASAQNRG